ncbi:hypothetical protein NDU88_001521 [Pleurodeles waltl]|uniref:Uncharacterized protein n=1 Tax=Pleurodeles waltl TaxID=8319 RepID=A0AAV7NFE1_PLEWA|nr:hypothetical protein NDU88_001521 [Pleurodeles waltl]
MFYISHDPAPVSAPRVVPVSFPTSPPFFASRLSLLFFVPHPRTWSGHASPEAWRLFHWLPGVSGLHNGAPPAPIPTLFRSSGERFPRLRCRRPPEPSVLFRLKTPIYSSSYSRRPPRKSEEASF